MPSKKNLLVIYINIGERSAPVKEPAANLIDTLPATRTAIFVAGRENKRRQSSDCLLFSYKKTLKREAFFMKVY